MNKVKFIEDNFGENVSRDQKMINLYNITGEIIRSGEFSKEKKEELLRNFYLLKKIILRKNMIFVVSTINEYPDCFNNILKILNS